MSGLVTDQTEIECDNENEDQSGSQVNDRDGENSGPSSDNSGEDNNQGEDNQGNCTTANLTKGTSVDEAELHTEGGAAVFEKVELGD